MLLHSCQITCILPCLADPEKIRVIAELSDEIQEVLPYPNAIIKGCIYNHPANTLTIKKDGKLLTLHFKRMKRPKQEKTKTLGKKAVLAEAPRDAPEEHST